MSIFVIGIDPGLNNLGISIIEYINSIFILKFFKEIKYSSKDLLEDKLYKIYMEIQDILYKFPLITIMGLEENFVNINNKTSLKNAMVNGILIMLSKKFNLKLQFMSPTFIKKKITGHGHASKEEIKLFIDNIISQDEFFISNKDNISDHVYDSLAISILAIL